MKALPLLLLPLAAMAAEPAAPAVRLEPVDHDPAWRLSAGFRAAPGVKTSAAVDARAAANAVLSLAAAGNAFSRTASKTGAGAGDSGTAGGQTRWEFDNGYIDLDDGINIDGETQNWHFDDASALSDGKIRAERPYDISTTTRTRTAAFPDPALLRDSSDETAAGVELSLDRTLWEYADFGLDAGIGLAWYHDADCFSIRGRALASADTLTVISESGTVVTTLSQPEFSDVSDILNSDGSIGGGYVNGGTVSQGYRIPVLTVSDENGSRFSTRTERRRSSSSRTTRSLVDVRSEGTLSMQELRLGARPFWKATDWLAVRADLGLLAIRSEIETDTRLTLNGAPIASIGRDHDDWTFGGYAGLSLSAALSDAVELSIGGELRLPHEDLRFDDGVVSGKVGLAKWSAFAAVGLRF